MDRNHAAFLLLGMILGFAMGLSMNKSSHITLIAECQKELKRTEFCELTAVPTINTEGNE